jgi:hypothetical protein
MLVLRPFDGLRAQHERAGASNRKVCAPALPSGTPLILSLSKDVAPSATLTGSLR